MPPIEPRTELNLSNLLSETHHTTHPRLEMLVMESKDIEEDEAISQYIISFTLARSHPSTLLLSYSLSLSFAQRDLDRRPKLP